MSTRKEAAARDQADAGGLLLLEYSPRQEAGSELDLDLDSDGRRHLGSNRDRQRTPLLATPFSLPPPVIPSSPEPPPPLRPSSPHAHPPTSRGIMMGLPVKGHSLRRVQQLPVAKGTLLPRHGKELFQHPVALPRRWNPLDALSRVEERFQVTS